MNFTRAKPGGWALFEILTSGQKNLVDQQLEFALDGASGGVYSPAGSLTWRNKWAIDTTVGAPPAGSALIVTCDAGRVAIEARGGDAGGFGLEAFGGALTSGIFSQGGDSVVAAVGGNGAILVGGANTSAIGGSFGGLGVVGLGGAGPAGGFGGNFVGGASNIADDVGGGAGVISTGGVGNGTSPGGNGLTGFGGASPGTGNGGFGVVAVGGAGTGGSTDGTGGDFIGGGVDGVGLIAIGAGGPIPTFVARVGGVFQGGAGDATGLIATATGNGVGIVGVSLGTAPGIQAECGGTGDALRAISLTGGYSVKLLTKSNAPVKSQIHMQPQDALPTTPDVGDVAFSDSSSPSGDGLFIYKNTPVTAWQRVITNLAPQASVAQAGGRIIAGALSSLSVENLSVSIVADFTMRFTFGLSPFGSGNDYHPMLSLFGTGVGQEDRIARLTQITSTFFDVKVYDLSAAADIDLDDAGTNLEIHAVVHGVI